MGLLHEYFFSNFAIKKNRLAIIQGDLNWTYSELRKHAGSYVAKLTAANCQLGDRIILEMEPCPEAIALIIACSILGLIFIPISPDTPLERAEKIGLNVEVALYIQKSESARSVNAKFHTAIIKNTELSISSTVREEYQEQRQVKPEDLAYMIFTSGTTGNPKGIMMSHNAAISFFKGMHLMCPTQSDWRLGTISPLQFDLSILDMGLAFGNAMTLVQIPRILIHHPAQFIRYLIKYNINQMNGVPSIWSLVLRYEQESLKSLACLKAILYAGEPFPLHDLKVILQQLPHLQVINCFGQSESIACTFKVLDFKTDLNKPIPIGRAHSFAKIYLLDENNTIIKEQNKLGEIYLQGPTLFSGYWRDLEATSRVLIPNLIEADKQDKMFKSGDLAYYNENNELIFAGRADFQVKILGNRIEIEEVERVIESHDKVYQAAIITDKIEGVSQLICFITTVDGFEVTKEAIISYCASKLPNYMQPSKVIITDNIPKNINGKLDRVALLNLL